MAEDIRKQMVTYDRRRVSRTEEEEMSRNIKKLPERKMGLLFVELLRKRL